MFMYNENPIRLLEGDELRDKANRFKVIDSASQNTHSQGPSHYLVECVEGPGKGRQIWVINRNLKDYVSGGKYYEAFDRRG